MLKSLKHQLYACGKKPIPEQIIVDDSGYQLEKVLKHDFYAATALYKSKNPTQKADSNPQKVILKLQRQSNFLFMPLAWLGRMLCHHEVSILRYLDSIQGTPNLLSLYGKNGFIYEFIEGVTLDETTELPQDFFDKLLELVHRLHQRDIIYLDMNKRGNIILDNNGNPHLIDFQISLHIGKKLRIFQPFFDYLRQMGQRADIYHLFKHKRRLSPELLRPHEYVISRHTSLFIKVHRATATPLRKLRRNLMRHFYCKGILAKEENTHYSPENDPERFIK